MSAGSTCRKKQNLPPMPSGHGQKGHPYFGWLSLKGNHSRKKGEKRAESTGQLGCIWRWSTMGHKFAIRKRIVANSTSNGGFLSTSDKKKEAHSPNHPMELSPANWKEAISVATSLLGKWVITLVGKSPRNTPHATRLRDLQAATSHFLAGREESFQDLRAKASDT